MWLDTFALLPLVALGTISLLKERKVLLYTITLFLSIFSNYYIGLFTCIFVALIFFCYQICSFKNLESFLRDLGRIALFSFLAIGMTAVLELPAFAALQTTQSSVNKFPQGFKLNIADENTWMGLFDAMRQVAGNMNGGITPSFKEGLPNLYCGIITNILAALYLTGKQIRIRDKLCCIALLLFFNLSFILRQLDYIWHGFHFTNMIPYRFSFLYSFVLLYMAYKAYLMRESFKPWQIVLSAILSFGLMLCAGEQDAAYWTYNGVFLLLYSLVFLLPHLFVFNKRKLTTESVNAIHSERKARQKISAYLLFGIMVLELILNIVNFGVSFTGTLISDYPRGKEYTASMIRYMNEREKDTFFYRAEVTHSQTLNDGALNGYNGISAFTSSANVRVTKFMQALGYGAKNTYNRYCFEEGSPVANLFLNLKYMLERQDRVEENAYFDDIHHYGKVHLLENNAYLPLGFMTKAQILNIDFPNAQSNAFLFQNELLKAATGLTEDAWSLMTGSQLSISSTDVTIKTQTHTGYCSYSTDAAAGTLVYTYAPDRPGLICIDLDLSKKNNYSVWKNGTQLYTETYSLPQTLSVANVVPGDIIEIHLTCKKSEKGTVSIHAGILDETVFRKAYGILNNSVLELTHFENTQIKGTVNCSKPGVLYTSIPQDGNWTAEVDGVPAETVLIGDAMVGLVLTEGNHEVVFTYKNESFSMGLTISLACTAIFIALYLSIYKPLGRKYTSIKE